MNAQASERYYAVDQTELVRQADGREQRRLLQRFRIKPDDLTAWCKANKLDEKRIKAVAMGEEYNYRGYVQGPFKHFTIGKAYVNPPRRDFGDEHEDKPVKKVNPFRLEIGRVHE
jgi:hypothetical protein